MCFFPILVLKECPCVGASPYCLHVSSSSFGRAGFEVIMSHIFPKGALAGIILVGDGAGMEFLEPEPGMSQAFYSAQWPTPSYWGQCWVPDCWSRNPEGWVRGGSVPSSCVCFPSSQHWHPCPRVEQCWSKRGWRGCLVWAWVQSWHQSEFWTAPNLLP